MAPASAESSSGKIRRIAIVFSGGPAPGANAVISAAAIAFLQTGLEVVGILHGYSKLISFSPDKPLVEDADYMTFGRDKLRRGRNRPGVMIGTARANPGKSIKSPADLKDATKSAPLKCVYEGLVSLGIDAARLDRRRRYAQDGQQVPALPRSPAGRLEAIKVAYLLEDDRQRLSRHRLRSATSPRSRRSPARCATCSTTPGRRAPTSCARRWAQRWLARLCARRSPATLASC